MEITARLEEIIKYVQSLQNQVGVIKTILFENEYHNKIFLSFHYRFLFIYIYINLRAASLHETRCCYYRLWRGLRRPNGSHYSSFCKSTLEHACCMQFVECVSYHIVHAFIKECISLFLVHVSSERSSVVVLVLQRFLLLNYIVLLGLDLSFISKSFGHQN